MTTDVSEPGALSGASARAGAAAGLARNLAVAAGIGWSILFVAIGLRYELQMYGDGAIFSYSVAVEDAWAFHWRNISGRLFVYVFSYIPAEIFVALTGNAKGGIAVYGFMRFVAPLLGLLATFSADRSQHRIIFRYACLSTACLCPLVFGFPTEMWMAHAVFWPALAICHYAPATLRGAGAVFAALLALVFTHAGAIILALAILATLILHGWRNAVFVRAASAFAAAMAIWLAVKLTIRPDSYIFDVLVAAAFNFIAPSNLGRPILVLLYAALAGYGVVAVLLRRAGPVRRASCAAVIVAAALAAYWLWFDRSLHADDRYVVRTVLLAVTPLLGVVAALSARGGWLVLPPRVQVRLAAALTNLPGTPAVAGAVVLVTLVYAVETAKFVAAWTDYRAAVRALAMGTASDPTLGDPRFVSAQRVGDALNRLAWNSTTPFLSALVAPGFLPRRLVVDPEANYFWISCATARRSEQTGTAVPAESRRLIRVHACLHR